MATSTGSHKMLLLILAAGAVILVGVVGYNLLYPRTPVNKNMPAQSNTNIPPRPCTMEAKLCANGSYVGRTGPNCEFTPCPDTPIAEPSVGYSL